VATTLKRGGQMTGFTTSKYTNDTQLPPVFLLSSTGLHSQGESTDAVSILRHKISTTATYSNNVHTVSEFKVPSYMD